MNCADFRRLWNEKLDADRVSIFSTSNVASAAGRPEFSFAHETELETHAANCPDCAAIDARFRKLSAAIHALPAPPEVSPEFLARLHRLPNEANRETVRLSSGTAWYLTAAAAVLVAGLTVAMVRPWNRAHPVAPPDALLARAEIAPRSISAAFADATSATLDLALEASAPAGRVGREVLASASLPEAESLPSLGVPSAPSAEILEGVGHRVGAGVKPLSGSARQAFGFLIRATTGDGADRPLPMRPSGT